MTTPATPPKPDPMIDLGNSVNDLREKVAQIEKIAHPDSLAAQIAEAIKKALPAPAAPNQPPLPLPTPEPTPKPKPGIDFSKLDAWMDDCPLIPWAKKK